MQLKVAALEDIDSILTLHAKYQVDTIEQEDKKDGFVTTAFKKEELRALIEQEQGIFIAVKNDEVIAYVMSASWQYWLAWPMFQHMVKDLPKLQFNNKPITVENSYQYGPVCIHKAFRGSGVLEALFDFALDHMEKRFDILVTFVNKINPRSYEAHKRKLGLEVIQEFAFNNNEYYEFVYDTSKRVQAKN